MKLYYFFNKDSQGRPNYGQEYFVMSESLEAAKQAVINCKEWKARSYKVDINEKGVLVVNENEVLHTEIC